MMRPIARRDPMNFNIVLCYCRTLRTAMKKPLVKRNFGPIRSYCERPTPFLKWAGGKSQLLDQMRPFFPREFGMYYEPFLGGGAVFFHLLPEKATLSDSNDELMNVYRVIQKEPIEVMRALDAYYPHRKSKVYYYRIRGLNPDELTSVERAARTIFLNKTCYNGLYRVNSEGKFNVPFGKYKNPSLYDKANILAASEALRDKKLRTADYRKACEEAHRGDFIYLDPPYQPLSKTASFTSYTKEAFSEKEQEDLAAVFRKLDRCGCRVMLSNSSTPFIRSLYEGYHIEPMRATRAINCKPSGRKAIEELLIMNYG
jgi:DNA adenine methylase